MSMIEFPIYVDPMGAVRMTQRSKWTNKNAQRYLSYKTLVGWEAKKHIKEPIDGPVAVTLGFYYRIPKSWSKRKKEDAEEQAIRPLVKPDIDNVVKGVFDALNGIAWVDDKLVTDLQTYKRYSSEPMIYITIKEVDQTA